MGAGLGDDGRRAAFRALAADLDRIDRAVYDDAGRDPLEPVLGEGDPAARVCLFGRDPGRHEVVHGAPFVGAGGQKVRASLHRVLHGTELPSFEASLEVGRYAFWANTVPYKPLGNKVWSAKVRKAFRPIVSDLLVHGWHGSDVFALGKVAFLWFATDRDAKARLEAHWARDDAFEEPLDVEIVAPDGASRTVALQPLPHPSPLNATWAPHVPRLFDGAFRRVGLATDAWRV